LTFLVPVLRLTVPCLVGRSPPAPVLPNPSTAPVALSSTTGAVATSSPNVSFKQLCVESSAGAIEIEWDREWTRVGRVEDASQTRRPVERLKL
jgi:hypothetical protein